MRYLFCAFGNPGLLYPLVGLALELRGRGHEVAFAAGPTALPVLDAVGIARIPRETRDGESFRIERWAEPLAIAVDVKHVEHGVRELAPDVLVGNLFGLAPLVVRERTGLPLCVMGMASYLYPLDGGAPAPYPECDAPARWRARGFLLSLNDARVLFGLPPVDPEGGVEPLLGDLFLVRSVPALEGDPARLPAGVHLAGACEWEPPLDARAVWEALRQESRSGEEPILYVQAARTFGEPNFWPHLVEALQDAPYRVFASTGRMDRPPEDLPPRFVTRPHLPQSAVLPHADLVITGGGSALVLGALTHAVPMLVVPGTGGEAADNAVRLERAGCALRLDPASLTPAALRAAVAEALGRADLRRGARRLRRAFAAVPGFRRAGDLVEGLRSPPARRSPAEVPAAAVGAVAGG